METEIHITDKISYLPCSEDPLSADIGIVRDGDCLWLYDVGANPQAIAGLTERCRVVLSHFHQDHTGNLSELAAEELYVSRETLRHTNRGTLVDQEMTFGNVRIFPLPSSHCKGCLGMEVDETYAFVGDALYSKIKGDCYLYNAYLLKEEIKVLKALHAPYLLVSHHPGMIRSREEVLAELEEIYSLREKNTEEILLKR